MALEMRLVDTIQAVDPQAWDACTAGHPFARHAFLHLLEASAALGVDRGVLPRYALLSDTTRGLVACAPAMIKRGTVREFGPELRWLKAGLAAGCFAWPKFQVGVPFFPVMGPKLLVRTGMAASPLRRALIEGLRRLGARSDRRSVFNILHTDPETARLCIEKGALLAAEHHSMWTNQGFANVDDYVARLPERKRYQYRKERRQAQSHGLTFRALQGPELTDEILADYYEGHRRVCERHGGKPWLPASTYAALAAGMHKEAILMGYFDGKQFVAGVLGLNAHVEQTLYLLQWSEMYRLSDVALDLVCYRPIDHALTYGMLRVDSGLAAPHKQLRGWNSTLVYHAHWFYNDELKSLAQTHLEGFDRFQARAAAE